MPEYIFMKPGMYIMAPVSISAAHCIYIPHIIANQQLGKQFPATKKSSKSRGIVGRVVFYDLRVVSKKSVDLSLYPPVATRQRLRKHVPAARNNSWRRRFLNSLFVSNECGHFFVSSYVNVKIFTVYSHYVEEVSV
jgi:hypothetical protein